MKTALIIGASGGIGKAILRDFYDEYDIVATSTKQESLDALKCEFPNIKTIMFDHTKREEEQIIKGAIAALSGAKLDCVVVASGITSDSLSIRLSDQLWDKTIEVNLSSSFRLLKHVYMQMNKGGAIILLSSVVAKMGNVGQVAYSASKGGLEAMVRTLAREFASKGITVNAVAPGFTQTKMTAMFDYEQLVKSVPLGRIGQPEEIAFAVKFLAHEKARYITGHTLDVNGGLWM
mgnify:CR=1 FL=1